MVVQALEGVYLVARAQGPTLLIPAPIEHTSYPRVDQRHGTPAWEWNGDTSHTGVEWVRVGTCRVEPQGAMQLANVMTSAMTSAMHWRGARVNEKELCRSGESAPLTPYYMQELSIIT